MPNKLLFITFILITYSLNALEFLDYSVNEVEKGLYLTLNFDSPVTKSMVYQKKGNVYIIKVPKAISKTYKGRQDLDHLLAISFHIKSNANYLEFWLYPRGFFGVELIKPLKQSSIEILIKDGYPSRKDLDPKNELKIICIDPGHGGHDPGAQGKLGDEKDMVLKIAKLLRDKINQIAGLKAFLTREEDYKIKLEDRPKISDKAGADLFISLHMNSSTPQAKGYEVFYISEKGIEQTIEAKLTKEHSIDSEEVISKESSTPDALLNQIILDLKQNEYKNTSTILAHTLAEHLKVTGRRNRGVKRAAFVVLKTFETASALIEMGYISNKEEEAYFHNETNVNKFTNALVSGIRSFFDQSSLIKAKFPINSASIEVLSPQDYEIYEVRAGDTLSSLAVRHGLKYSSLLNANEGLKPNKLIIGQKIKIPVLND